MTHRNLSIFNFKYQWMRNIVSIVIVALILLWCICRLNYIYFDEEEWPHVLLHDFYTSENIDNIFVGSSHVYNAVNPELLDKINGMNNFNMSSGNLTLSASYYVIREAARDNQLQNVFLELYYYPNTGERDVYSDETRKYNWRISSYMKPSINKYAFIFRTNDTTHYLESLFPFIRYRAHLFDSDYVNAVLEKKKSDGYKNYYIRGEIEDGGILEYRDKGYLYTTGVYTQEEWLSETLIDFSKEGLLSDGNQKYLKRIIEYCQKHNIGIKLFISPMYELHMMSTVDYDSYYQQIKKIADDYQVEFYDFNLCKAEYLDIPTYGYLNEGHLNATGADIFTPVMWEVLSNDEIDNKGLFCESFKERITQEEPRTYGVFYSVEDGVRHCEIATNCPEEFQYRIVKTGEEDSINLLQDFSKNRTFDLLTEEHGTLTIVSKDTKDDICTIKINY